MIKVNLTKTKITKLGEVSTIGTTTESPTVDARDFLIKIPVLLGATIALLVYEHFNITNLEAQLKDVTAQATQLGQTLAEKQKITAPMKDAEAKAKELEDKLKIMKKLSRLRLRTVKALDLLQSSIPDRLWFTSVKLTNNKMSMHGYASTDEDISSFTKAMENSTMFTNVLLLRSEMTKTAGGEYKEFEINCNSEVGE